MVVIIDYGAGNLDSVTKAARSLGSSIRVSSNSSVIKRGKKIILPGVGHFGEAVNELKKRDQIKMASEIGEEVEEGTMPMAIYILMHSEADLSQDQRESILVWSEQFAEQLFER